MLLTYLLVFVLLFSGYTANKESDSLIQKNCKVISILPSPLDTQDSLNLCIASLKENPESQRVRNKMELIVVGTNNAISNITNMKKITEKFIKEKRYKSGLIKKKLEDCLKHYVDGYEWLTSGLNYLKEKDREMATPDLGMAKLEVVACEKEFKKGNVNPLKKESEVLYMITNIPYIFSSMADE